jgi:hypothetical protein
MLAKSLQSTLGALIELLQQLPDEVYSTPCLELSNATIGEHTRHSIELFQCLLTQYHSGIINYDQRARDLVIQTKTAKAIEMLELILIQSNKPNKPLKLQHDFDDQLVELDTTYYRELVFTLDHCVHHQALIKVALRNATVKVDENFGVAKSTLAYRTQCAQ